jgi:hypothetical protein
MGQIISSTFYEEVLQRLQWRIRVYVQLKKNITTVRIRSEGWDKYQIVAYTVGCHMIWNMPIFEKFKSQGHSKYLWKWIFQKPRFLKISNKKASPKLFIILASHMESLILASEWHVFPILFRIFQNEMKPR